MKKNYNYVSRDPSYIKHTNIVEDTDPVPNC